MGPAEGIRQKGFRKWYERELVESHLFLVSAFLCLIAVVALLESVRDADGMAAKGGLILLAAGAGGVGFRAWYRFQHQLARAEHLGDQSHCPSCRAYARFEVLDAGHPRQEIDDGMEHPWLRVRCRKCGHAWVME